MNTNKKQDSSNYKNKIKENNRYSDYFLTNNMNNLCLPSFNGFSKNRETGIIDIEAENQLKSLTNSPFSKKKSTFYNKCDFDFKQKNRNYSRIDNRLGEIQTDNFNRRIIPFQYNAVNSFSFYNSRSIKK